MPRRCTVCEHEKVEEINRFLIAGEALRKIAELVPLRVPLSITALHRHKESHLPAHLVKGKEAQEITRADSLLNQVVELRDKALSLLAQAEQAGELRTALQGVREAKGCLELLARLQGELQDQTTINLLVNPQWLSLRTVMLQALDGYPEARLAIAEALQRVETNAGK